MYIGFFCFFLWKLMLKIFPHIENAQKSSINFRVILQLKDAHSAKKNIAIILKITSWCCRRYSSYMYRGQQHRRSSSTDEGTVGAHQTLHFQKCSKKTILLYSHLSNTLFVPFIFILTFVAWTFGSREFIKILWNINLHWLLKLTDYRMAIFR